jgi:hypothetical protein
MDDAGPPDRFGEGITHLGVQRAERMLDRLFRHQGVRQVDAVETRRVLAHSRTTADPDVLGYRPHQVDREVHIESGARQHAGQGGTGQPGRVTAAQVNHAGNGTRPAVGSHAL